MMRGPAFFVRDHGTSHRDPTAGVREPPPGEPLSNIRANIGNDADELALMMGEQEIDQGLRLIVVSRHHRTYDQASAKLTDRRESLGMVFIANHSEFCAFAQQLHQRRTVMAVCGAIQRRQAHMVAALVPIDVNRRLIGKASP